LFCFEAIKKKKPNKVKCDADEIDVYSQQEAPLSAPATSLLVAVRVWFKFFSSLQDGWKKEDEEASVERGVSKSSPQ